MGVGGDLSSRRQSTPPGGRATAHLGSVPGPLLETAPPRGGPFPPLRAEDQGRTDGDPSGD